MFHFHSLKFQISKRVRNISANETQEKKKKKKKKKAKKKKKKKKQRQHTMADESEAPALQRQAPFIAACASAFVENTELDSGMFVFLCEALCVRGWPLCVDRDLRA